MAVRFEDGRFYSRGEVRRFGFNVAAVTFLRWEKKGLPSHKAPGSSSSRVYYRGSDLNRFFGL
jgi:hypothetical protein